MIVLDGYFDESGTHDGSETIVVAGFLALANAWRSFGEEWNAALKDYQIPFFHMSKFAQKVPPYDWPEEMRRGRLAHLIDITNRHVVESFGIAIPKKLFDSVFTRSVRQIVRGPYGFASWLIVTMIARALDQIPFETGVAYIFENGAQRKGELLAAYDGLDRLPGGKAALHVLSLRFEDKRRFVPLQAADMLAYELYLDRPRQNNPESRRIPLQLLKRGYWRDMTEPNLKAFAAVCDMLLAGDLTPQQATSAAIWQPILGKGRSD